MTYAKSVGNLPRAWGDTGRGRMGMTLLVLEAELMISCCHTSIYRGHRSEENSRHIGTPVSRECPFKDI